MIRLAFVRIACALVLLVLFARSLCHPGEEFGTVSVNAVNQCYNSIVVHLRSVLNSYPGQTFLLSTFESFPDADTIVIGRYTEYPKEETLGVCIVTCLTVDTYNPGEEEKPEEIINVTFTEPEKDHLAATAEKMQNFIRVSYIDYVSFSSKQDKGEKPKTEGGLPD